MVYMVHALTHYTQLASANLILNFNTILHSNHGYEGNEIDGMHRLAVVCFLFHHEDIPSDEIRSHQASTFSSTHDMAEPFDTESKLRLIWSINMTFEFSDWLKRVDF